MPMFSDNYGWILRNAESGEIAAVDPAEPDTIEQALDERCALCQSIYVTRVYCRLCSMPDASWSRHVTLCTAHCMRQLLHCPCKRLCSLWW